MVRPKKPIKDETLKQWLTEFRNKSTKQGYLASLRMFKKNLGIEDLGEYVKSNPDATADMRKFLVSMEDRPSKTIAAYTAAVRVFMVDHTVTLEENNWRKLRRRGFFPKRVKAETRDKKPSKQQLKQILNYADIKARAMILFLVSSGTRIGEILQLKKEDFDLEADPPRVHIRDEITKGGTGGRTTYFSYEARDAIKDWLRIKDSIKKRSGGSYGGERVFSWSVYTARFMWNMACDKAGIGTRDKRTGRRVYHLHSLRKFFRTKIGLDLDMTNALMGHAEYLDDSYLRLEEEGEIAKAYLDTMPNVSVYQIADHEVRKQVEPILEELEALKKKYTRLESMYEATAHLYQKLNPQEIEKTVRQILRAEKGGD